MVNQSGSVRANLLGLTVNEWRAWRDWQRGERVLNLTFVCECVCVSLKTGSPTLASIWSILKTLLRLSCAQVVFIYFLKLKMYEKTEVSVLKRLRGFPFIAKNTICMPAFLFLFKRIRGASVAPSAGEERNISSLNVFFAVCRTRCWRKDTSMLWCFTPGGAAPEPSRRWASESHAGARRGTDTVITSSDLSHCRVNTGDMC